MLLMQQITTRHLVTSKFLGVWAGRGAAYSLKFIMPKLHFQNKEEKGQSGFQVRSINGKSHFRDPRKCLVSRWAANARVKMRQVNRIKGERSSIGPKDSSAVSDMLLRPVSEF